MRSLSIALGVLGLLMVGGPSATAEPALADASGPVDPLWAALERVEPGPPVGDEFEVARDAARDAVSAALPAQDAPLPPLVAPVEGIGAWFDPLALAGIGAALALGMVAFFFYGGARFVTPAEVLQNDVRQQIYRYLKQGVGANLKQLTDDLRLTTTNAIWHLRKLEDAGLIHSKRFNGYKVFYCAEGGIEARRMSLSVTALTNANAQEVFEYVMAHPGTHQREIARALAVNHGTVRWHLKKLLGAELITETKRGKTSAYFATETGMTALSCVVRNAEARASAAVALVASSS